MKREQRLTIIVVANPTFIFREKEHAVQMLFMSHSRAQLMETKTPNFSWSHLSMLQTTKIMHTLLKLYLFENYQKKIGQSRIDSKGRFQFNKDKSARKLFIAHR